MGEAFAGIVSTEEREAQLMGTNAHVIVTGGKPGLAQRAVERLERLEARWSRFLPDSEITRLNEHPGVPVLVSPETYLLVERAIEGWRLTGGLFDPTLLRELRAAGYDRSFELLKTRGPSTQRSFVRSADSSAAPRPRADAITLDPLVRTVRLPPGVELDPGGIGKGLAADLVVEELLADGASGAMVSIGGDLRAEGAAPEGCGWIVAVGDPRAPDRVVATLALNAGAVASTWRTKRSWVTADGAPRHHLLDPRTGTSAATGLAGVTVVAGRGWQAEVLAKAAFLAGRAGASPVLGAHCAGALLVTDDGATSEVGDLAPFVVADGSRAKCQASGLALRGSAC
jgi:thiamine biosynthesis lipoprotein